MAIAVASYGLGPIGQGIAQLAARRTGVRFVGAVDIDPAKLGTDFGTLLGLAPSGVSVSADIETAFAAQKPDVVFHATGSSLARVEPQLQQLLAQGVHVISTCEELAYPWSASPALSEALDATARRHGVCLLGTGVNPGYAMDALPLALTAPCREVQSVSVLRVVDAGKRRAQLQQKVGAGITVAQFDERVKAGTLRHVGLPESLQMIAGGLGWRLERATDDIQPVLADMQMQTDHVLVEAGQVAGVRQVACGYIGGREVIRLELRMYVGAADPQDTVIIAGDPPVHMTIAGGLHGDLATAAMIVNAVPSVMRARPGLATMADLPLVHAW